MGVVEDSTCRLGPFDEKISRTDIYSVYYTPCKDLTAWDLRSRELGPLAFMDIFFTLFL